MKVSFAFHLEIKVPESGGRVERHRSHVCMFQNQDGAAMFGRRPGRSAKTVLLFTFLYSTIFALSMERT